MNGVQLQTYTDWEVWIGINGHGSDGGEVAEVARRIAGTDSRIHVVVQGPPLKGKVESMNHLVSLATSDWIAVLDCDDIWDRRKLERQFYIIHNGAQDAAVIGTFCRYFGQSHTYPQLPHGYINPVFLITTNPIINSSSLIKKQYCTWEYNEINYGVEDFHLWMKICLSGGKLYNLPEFLTWHRIHKTSAFNSQGYSDVALRAWYQTEYVKLSSYRSD